ncbi:MAG: hypothetical protein DRI95_16090 [Bacteroidetes bacterium]|nr:MAG: hypothetical protein DRI95_16090 [Bacteroidota bacterium]RLD78479.1 MAG: hypothetical protein DRJ07_13130 [Bacteroidota bacterium]
MEIAEEDLEKMYDWINRMMKTDTWYPIKSEKAFDVIMHLFKEGVLLNCELDENETHIRKIDNNLISDN